MSGNPFPTPKEYMDKIDLVRDRILKLIPQHPEILDHDDLTGLRYGRMEIPPCSYAQGRVAIREAKAKWKGSS